MKQKMTQACLTRDMYLSLIRRLPSLKFKLGESGQTSSLTVEHAAISSLRARVSAIEEHRNAV